MKKRLSLVFMIVFAFSLLSCTEVTSTDFQGTSSVTTANATTTTEVTTRVPTSVTSILTTTEPTLTTNITTTQTTTETTTETTTQVNRRLYFVGGVGEGTETSPYVVEMIEMDDYFKSISKNYESSDLSFEEGTIEEGVFTVLDNSVEPGLDLSKSTNSSFKVNALRPGEFCVRVNDGDLAELYIKINVSAHIVDYSKSLKVLAIGNSFSVDGMEYLYKIAADYGVENIVLGNLYIPGAALTTHVDSITNDLNNYVYLKNTNDNWLYENSTATLLDGLLDEEWDVITIQQVSGNTGLPNTYNGDIDTIINYVNSHKTNPFAKIVWHMTWAYAESSTHWAFPYYNSDQLTMYSAITATVQDRILTRDDIEYVIPSGTAIQNLRTSYIGDTLNRDGFHLSYDLGRYTAGLTWFRQITGLSINAITYLPNNVSVTDLLAMIEAVNNAVENPYVVTNSTYLTE